MTQEESILHNLETWCYEVGSEFEEMGRQAAEDFIKYITKSAVLELGCGDGASNEVFMENNIQTLSVDINPNKLSRLRHGLIVGMDMLDFLRSCKTDKVNNIFAHHSLEHTVCAEEILTEVSRVLCPNGIFYAIVPAHDHLHSVHHTVFESPDELLPPGFKPIVMQEQNRKEPEWICVAQKLV